MFRYRPAGPGKGNRDKIPRQHTPWILSPDTICSAWRSRKRGIIPHRLRCPAAKNWAGGDLSLNPPAKRTGCLWNILYQSDHIAHFSGRACSAVRPDRYYGPARFALCGRRTADRLNCLLRVRPPSGRRLWGPRQACLFYVLSLCYNVVL